MRTDLIGETVLIPNPNYDPMKDDDEFLVARIRAVYPSFSTSPTPFAIIEHEHGELQIDVKVSDLKVKKDIHEEEKIHCHSHIYPSGHFQYLFFNPPGPYSIIYVNMQH